MKYRLKELQLFATLKAEKMFEFKELPNVEFEFPSLVRVALAISCGLVRGSVRGGEDYYEVVLRLYQGANPQQTNENHIGKLYIAMLGHPNRMTFRTSVERFEWYEDGSFEVITAEGERRHIRSSSSNQNIKSILQRTNYWSSSWNTKSFPFARIL